MKNKNKWLLTSNTHKGIKHIKPCPSLMGKDQFVLFMNGFPQKGVKDYDSLVNLVGSLATCVQCHDDCSICLTFNEYTENISLTLNLVSNAVILFSSEIHYNTLSDIDNISGGIIPITETLIIPLSYTNYLTGSEQRELYIYGYNLEGICVTKKLIIETKELAADITEFDLSDTISDITPLCSDGTLSVAALSIPDGSSISVNTDTWIITLIDTTTSAENKFILGIYCDNCLVGLYSVHTR